MGRDVAEELERSPEQGRAESGQVRLEVLGSEPVVTFDNSLWIDSGRNSMDGGVPVEVFSAPTCQSGPSVMGRASANLAQRSLAPVTRGPSILSPQREDIHWDGRELGNAGGGG